MNMDDCIFCKIVTNEAPSYTVYEDEKTRAFLDINGATDGHTMVVHKKHGWSLSEYTPEELKDLWTTVQKVTAAIEKAFNTGILSIGINHKEPKGVHHLHVHVIPRYEKDGGGVMQSLPKRARKEDLTVIMEKVRRCL